MTVYLHVSGCDEHRIRADEGALSDLGAVLRLAVVIAEDGAGPDVGPVADAAVTDIGKVVGLRALPDLGFLHLHEISDPRSGAELRARAQPRERADRGAFANMRADQVG